MGDQPQYNASLSSSSSNKKHEGIAGFDQTPPIYNNASQTKKRLSKQLSMCEIPRTIAWEKKRRQFLLHERKKNGINHEADNLTDEDMNELKGCIELGFGFNQQDGQRLCTTIPALDLFLAVNRQVYTSPISSPGSTGSATSFGASIAASSMAAFGERSSSCGSDSDSWKICSPGDDPQNVKTKLRHWAQAVACSLRQSS